MISTIDTTFLTGTEDNQARVKVKRTTDDHSYYYDYSYKLTSLENSVSAVKQYIKRYNLQSYGGSWIGGYTSTGYCFVHVKQTVNQDDNIIVCFKDAI